MQTKMETLRTKHTWDLAKPPPGANVMDSMWVYDIKWDGEGNRIKDKARVVGKGYTQQLGVDYNETWAGVTRLESVRMTAAIAAKHDLRLWRIDFIGAYLNSLTKEDISQRASSNQVMRTTSANSYILFMGQCREPMTGMKPLEGCSMNLGIPHLGQIHASTLRRKEETTPSWTHTDDIFGASNSDKETRRRKDEIGRFWDIKDVGEMEYFLGMQVQQDLTAGTI